MCGMTGKDRRIGRPTRALHAVPDAPGAGAAPTAQHMLLAPVEVIAPIADRLLDEVGAVRSALDAELALCGVFGVVRQGIEGDAEERELALTSILVQVLGYAEAQHSEPALALARVCAALGPVISRDFARDMAERLVVAGVADRP